MGSPPPTSGRGRATPTGALRLGADLVLSSTHKIVGSLTQSAILHLGSSELVDPGVVDRSVTLVESTSPSALLTASLDAARRLAATRGRGLLDDINLELFSENVVVALFGLGERAAPRAERLLAALRHAVAEIGEADLEERRAFAEPPPWGPLERSPRDAFLGPQQVVPFERAEGRISAESLAAYPPGVPNVLPGERLTGETLAYIPASLAHGRPRRG